MLIYIITTLFLVHPFYVSVSDFVFDSEESSLQITKKIFFDDLELVLKNENNNENFDILNSKNDIVNNYIESYIKEHLLFKADGNLMELNYLGHEYVNGTINLYLEIINIKNIKSIEIKDTSLFNYFEAQENLTYIEIDNQRFTIRLRKENSSKKLIL